MRIDLRSGSIARRFSKIEIGVLVKKLVDQIFNEVGAWLIFEISRLQQYGRVIAALCLEKIISCHGPCLANAYCWVSADFHPFLWA